jgi:hypothetical protein
LYRYWSATADDQEVKTVMADKKMIKMVDLLEEEMRMVFDHYSRGVVGLYNCVVCILQKFSASRCSMETGSVQVESS